MTNKHTIYIPEKLKKETKDAYDVLLNIDSNFSKLIQCILYSIIKTAKYIVLQKKNFRHYEWHLIIHDRETNQYFSTYDINKNNK